MVRGPEPGGQLTSGRRSLPGSAEAPRVPAHLGPGFLRASLPIPLLPALCSSPYFPALFLCSHTPPLMDHSCIPRTPSAAHSVQALDWPRGCPGRRGVFLPSGSPLSGWRNRGTHHNPEWSVPRWGRGRRAREPRGKPDPGHKCQGGLLGGGGHAET